MWAQQLIDRVPMGIDFGLRFRVLGDRQHWSFEGGQASLAHNVTFKYELANEVAAVSAGHVEVTGRGTLLGS